MTLEVVTFGCRLNTYESEVIKKLASQSGLSNTIIFNGCAVTAEAERQLRQAIRKAKRDKPNVKIVVTGCAAQINPEQYSKMSEVDFVIGNQEKIQAKTYETVHQESSKQLWEDDVERVIVNDIMSIQETAHHLVDNIDGYSRAFIQVQNGCNHRCTYCTIPFGRGNSRSVGVGEVVSQCQRLVSAGYKEIVLSGIDITDYGLDLPGQPSLGYMITKVLEHVPELERLRLSSIDVGEIDDELFHLIEHQPRLMPHLHLSLQSGDNLILKRMKRRHSREQVKAFCERVRSLRPNIAIGADIIVGFPTESDEMFQNTYNLIEEVQIPYLHIFPYSKRDDTPAARMPQVQNTIKKERVQRLRALGAVILRNHLSSQIGKRVNIVVEEVVQNDKTYCISGRAEDFSKVTIQSDHKQEVKNICAAIVEGYSDHSLICSLV
ncbi:tRNA (N(6)-L-threonylcarbamoyladenosine(37)-C(2))-methylthiotransferase MtaB [Rickettsiales endosymbiont of Peranema trichophorum]|nr:tRNA (N(6)-L-threonylcarbamoyladenosine(37)-C(2))-methylthiotransferase MtaB [Rickettsiales endosymbiont of Peranema trichophorum]RZI46344.1 tRNA (N(6)-L-threonylcarbamoyladenosine(37)-C(2))-methylthiotransferase MtaB [Rickettsiales endosymbiont of Peranema trichophorum]